MADVGTGTSISFGTSGFTAEVLGINHNGVERPSIDTSHLTTTTAKTFMPGDLVDQGEFSLDIAFNPNILPPIKSAAETIVITFPVPSGLSTGATYTFTGFCTGASQVIPFEERMTGTVTIKVSGDITKANAA